MVLHGVPLGAHSRWCAKESGMTRDDLFEINAGIARRLLKACEKFCPVAVVGVIVNLVDSVVPAMCEHYKKSGLDHRKIVGVTTLHVVNANKFTSSLTGSSMRVAQNRVIGGHAGVTIFPPFSLCLVGSSSPWIRWRIWISVCKMEAPNWSWRKLQPGLAVASAECQNKRRERHDSVETLYPTS